MDVLISLGWGKGKERKRSCRDLNRAVYASSSQNQQFTSILDRTLLHVYFIQHPTQFHHLVSLTPRYVTPAYHQTTSSSPGTNINRAKRSCPFSHHHSLQYNLSNKLPKRSLNLTFFPSYHATSSLPPTQPRPRIMCSTLTLPSRPLRIRISPRPTRVSLLRKMAVVLLVAWRRARRWGRRNVALWKVRGLRCGTPLRLLLRRLTPRLVLLLLGWWWREELLVGRGRDRVILVVYRRVVACG